MLVQRLLDPGPGDAAHLGEGVQPVRPRIEIVMLELRGGGVPVGCVIDSVEAADILDFDAGPGHWAAGGCSSHVARRARLGRGTGQGTDHEADADPLHVLSGVTTSAPCHRGTAVGSEAVQAAGCDAGGGA